MGTINYFNGTICMQTQSYFTLPELDLKNMASGFDRNFQKYKTRLNVDFTQTGT